MREDLLVVRLYDIREDFLYKIAVGMKEQVLFMDLYDLIDIRGCRQ